jgi:uncharacterized membrane protein
MDIVKQLLGRLHPLIVHLPVGFIILGLLLQVYDRKQKQYPLVIALIYLWAGYSAILACITGYLQYLGEGYSFPTVKLHLWSGIATALFSFLMWAKLRGSSRWDTLSKVPMAVLSVIFFLLISFTGHQGGNITHGEDYLVAPLPDGIKSALGYEVVEPTQIVLTEEDWKNANLYAEVVQPILNNNCVSCHNPKKKKGGLLLTSAENILQGGEHGDVVTKGQPDKSDLFTRMELPKEDDQHMPPDGKTQPSKEEIKIIGVWIAKNLPLDKTIGELSLEKDLFQSFIPKNTITDYPSIEINKAPLDSINLLKNKGLHVDPISENTNFLKVSALNWPSFQDADIMLLHAIAPQVAILDLGGTQITDAIFKELAIFPNLTILKLDRTQVTGEHIALLRPLRNLRTLNLTQTAFIEAYLDRLKELQALEKVYLYNPDWPKTGSETLGQSSIELEYGNYALPILESDSIIY